MKLFLALILLLSSCSPMPGKSFLPGVTQEVNLSTIDLIVHPLPILTAVYECDKRIAKYSQLTLLLSAGIIPACAEWKVSGGQVVRCEVWYPDGSNYLLEHELMHCQGYSDLL